MSANGGCEGDSIDYTHDASNKSVIVKRKDVEGTLPILVREEFKGRKIAGDIPEVTFGVGGQDVWSSGDGKPVYVDRDVGNKLWSNPDFPEVEVVLIPKKRSFLGKQGNFSIAPDNSLKVYGGQNVNYQNSCHEDNPFLTFEYFEGFCLEESAKRNLDFWRRVCDSWCGYNYDVGLYPYKKLKSEDYKEALPFLESAAKAVVDVVEFGRGMDRINRLGKAEAILLKQRDGSYNRLVSEVAYHEGKLKNLYEQIKVAEEKAYLLPDLSLAEPGALEAMRQSSKLDLSEVNVLLGNIGHHTKIRDHLNNAVSARDKELTLQAYRNIFEGRYGI